MEFLLESMLWTEADLQANGIVRDLPCLWTPGDFPETIASSLYVEVMEHGYFMSEMEKRDVGLAAAPGDYPERFAHNAALTGSIVRAFKALFRGTSAPGNLTMA